MSSLIFDDIILDIIRLIILVIIVFKKSKLVDFLPLPLLAVTWNFVYIVCFFQIKCLHLNKLRIKIKRIMSLTTAVKNSVRCLDVLIVKLTT